MMGTGMCKFITLIQLVASFVWLSQPAWAQTDTELRNLARVADSESQVQWLIEQSASVELDVDILSIVIDRAVLNGDAHGRLFRSRASKYLILNQSSLAANDLLEAVDLISPAGQRMSPVRPDLVCALLRTDRIAEAAAQVDLELGSPSWTAGRIHVSERCIPLVLAQAGRYEDAAQFWHRYLERGMTTYYGAMSGSGTAGSTGLLVFLRGSASFFALMSDDTQREQLIEWSLHEIEADRSASRLLRQELILLYCGLGDESAAEEHAEELIDAFADYLQTRAGRVPSSPLPDSIGGFSVRATARQLRNFGVISTDLDDWTCTGVFDVNVAGRPVNLRTRDCSSEALATVVRNALDAQLYAPLIVDGVVSVQSNLEQIYSHVEQ
jgi:hypothetical protein